VDLGGCLNLLTPPRSQLKKGHSMGSSTAMVQVVPWDGNIQFTRKVREGDAAVITAPVAVAAE